MMVWKAVLVLGLVTVVGVYGSRRPVYSYAAPQVSSEETYDSREAKNTFNYAVKDDYSGNYYGHQETRDGDHTQGSYYVQLPDGRVQTVTYYVDGDSGYVAHVSYDGEAHYPESYESYEEESREAAEYSPSRYAPPRRAYG